MTMTGLMLGDAPKEPVVTPPASLVETATGVINDPTLEAAAAAAAVEKPAASVEGLPDGFKTVADLAKSYTELRTKMSSGKPEPVVTPEDAIAKAGADMSAAEAEYTKDGKVSDATLAALVAKGLSKEVVTNYFAGQEAVAKQTRAEFAQIAGGESQLDAILKWAPSTLTAAEVTAYENAIKSGDATTAKMLFQGIAARYVAANGSDPKLVTGGTVPSSGGVQPYESHDQVIQAMSDPKYKTDPAYQKKVYARLAVTKDIY